MQDLISQLCDLLKCVMIGIKFRLNVLKCPAPKFYFSCSSHLVTSMLLNQLYVTIRNSHLDNQRQRQSFRPVDIELHVQNRRRKRQKSHHNADKCMLALPTPLFLLVVQAIFSIRAFSASINACWVFALLSKRLATSSSIESLTIRKCSITFSC